MHSVDRQQYIRVMPLITSAHPFRDKCARRLKIPISRVLMPIGMAAILGGTLTMIGTSALILLNDILPAGMPRFGFLELTPIGLGLVLKEEPECFKGNMFNSVDWRTVFLLGGLIPLISAVLPAVTGQRSNAFRTATPSFSNV